MDEKVVEGGLYLLDNGDSTFSIVKVLVATASGVLVRLYKDSFTTPPPFVDPSELRPADRYESGDEGIGVGYWPIPFRHWVQCRPVFLSQDVLLKEELLVYLREANRSERRRLRYTWRGAA